MNRRCIHCNGKLGVRTDYIHGTDEIGYYWVCLNCASHNFSEIIDYTKVYVITERRRRMKLLEE